MKVIKLFFGTLISIALVLIFIDLIILYIEKPSDKSLMDLFMYQIPILLILPLNVAIGDRSVERKYSKKDFRSDKFENQLRKYRAKIVSEDEKEKIYKLSYLYSFNGKVTQRIDEEFVTVTGPNRFIGEL